MRTPLVLLLASLVCLTTAPRAGAEDVPLNKRVSSFKKALRSKDPKARARAFELLRGAQDPAVVDHLTWGIRELRKEESQIEKEQTKTEAEYQKLFDKLADAQMALDAAGNNSRAVERFNKTSRKISKGMDAAVLRLKNLENDHTRSRAQLDSVAAVATELLKELQGEAFSDALGRLTTQWLQAKAIEDRQLWFDAVYGIDSPAVTNALHGVLEDGEMPTALRVRALDVLAWRGDGTVLGKALGMLKLPRDEQPFLLAAIRTLRYFHDKRGIEPLIAFLEREDLKRERTDAQLALTSLTGVDHGPYAVQWKKWWEDNKATFVMPKDPKPTGNVKPPKKGTTFYGIQTLSDKVLFIVDISGSMDKQLKGGEAEGGKTKWEVLQAELIGAVYGLAPTDTFNVIFFNHAVIPWKTAKVQANDLNKDAVKAWIEKQKPVGGTNLFDSFEMGFRIAHRVTGPPDLDTVFFLTDGRPTAGKIRDRQRMLQIFKEWNTTAHLTIHTIGVGADHDIEFMKELARIGDGRYVSTVPVPDIDVSATALEPYGPPVVDFAAVPANTVHTRDIVVTNLGNGPLTLKDIRVDRRSRGFRLGPDMPKTPFSLGKGEKTTIKLVLEVGGEGTYEGTLRVESNDGGDPVMEIQLRATVPAAKPDGSK